MSWPRDLQRSSDVLDALSGRGEPSCAIALVVAHQDDEVVGVGGQLYRWRSQVACVYATDGAPRDGVDARRAGFTNGFAYARARAAESRRALALAGVRDDQRHEIAFPDRSLVHRLDDLESALRALLARLRPDVIVTHALEGGHPDHDALSLVVGRIVSRAEGGLSATPVIEFAGYAEGPDGRLMTNRFGGERTDGRRLALTPSDADRKQRMLDCFETQRRVLEPFGTTEEWLRIAPGLGDLPLRSDRGAWYDHLGWEITSAGWTRLATAYLEGDGCRPAVHAC